MKYRMKKFMLLMSAALLSLSACSKKADEPVVKAENDEELATIHLTIEGEREDVAIVDEEGRALNLTGTTNGNRLTGVTLGDAQEVDGIICLYTDQTTGLSGGTNGFARKVKFKVEGNKISFKGNISVTRIRKGYLPYKKMNIYIGGDIKSASILTDKKTTGGSIEYNFKELAMRTQGTMDLSKFNPIFYSEGIPVVDGTAKLGGMDYYSTGHRFKLLGEFVSFRFRMNNGADTRAKFNGFLIRGFGHSAGVTIDEAKAENGNKVQMRVSVKAVDDPKGKFIRFEDQKEYYIDGDNTAPFLDPTKPNEKTDAAYTLYLFTPVEPSGGIRMGLNDARTTIFKTNPRQNGNFPAYWGGGATGPSTFKSRAKNFGKFHNLILKLNTIKDDASAN